MDKNFDCPGCDRWINNEMLETNNNSCPYCGLSFNNKELMEDLKKDISALNVQISIAM